MFNGQNVNSLNEVFGPISHRPFTKPFHLAGPAGMIVLNGIANLQRILRHLIKDPKQLLAARFETVAKNFRTASSTSYV